jgi:hypothetical protein
MNPAHSEEEAYYVTQNNNNDSPLERLPPFATNGKDPGFVLAPVIEEPAGKHGGKWLADESGTWVADYCAALAEYRGSFVETELWGAIDCLIKLDHKICVKFPKPPRTLFAYSHEDNLLPLVREFQPPPDHKILNPTGHDYFTGTVLSRDSEAGVWKQNEVELVQREVIHYKVQPALPFEASATGVETFETDLTGLRGQRKQCQRLVLRGLKMLARNYWLEALHRFNSEEFREFKNPKYREKLKFKMRRVMRKLCQRLELLTILMPHEGHECLPPRRECLDSQAQAPTREPEALREPVLLHENAANEAPAPQRRIDTLQLRRIDTSQLRRKMQHLALQRAAAGAGAATSQTHPQR